MNLNLDNIFLEIDNINMELNNQKQCIVNTQNKLKKISRLLKKEVKSFNKNLTKIKTNKGNKSPSGFAKPTLVTKELCNFLNKDEGTKMARTEVTKLISSYIKENNLGNTIDKRNINPDNKLKQLLNVSDDETITYFNIQKYMNQHFIKENTTNDTVSNILEMN
jgi:chromatin remodeling complex protein RSC6